MAKKLREEDLVLNIIVNGNKGQKETAALGRTMRDAKIEVELLTAEQKKLEKQGKKDSARYRELTNEINRNNAVIDSSRKKLTELGQSMKLVDQSTSQLRRTLTQLNRLKSQAIPGSEQYIKYDQQIKAINSRLTELRVGSQQTGGALQRMGSNFQRYLGIISAGIASFIGATMGIIKAIDEYARFDDKMADVQKTTNLTKEGVKALNAELEKIDTRTSQEDLLGLGRIGGKIGLTDPEELRGFVESSNQLIVALNEDLGGNVEETVNIVGKLVSVFGVKKEFGIEQSILKVGSVINELGMASEANEGKIVDFTNRMAGVAPLAGISIQEILGLGATLDQFAQSPEVSGTALSKLFLNMSKDAKTFSKYAGMEVKAFKKLLETDFMGAFKKVLVGVKGNSAGINELAATLGDLGLDGQRVIGVIGTLANHHETLTEQIDLANKAFDEGTSLTDEYNIKNETAAAQLEKKRKEVTLLWRELGEKLFPAYTKGYSTLLLFIKALGVIIQFLMDNYKWILTLTVGITAYTIAVNAAAIATGIKTTAVRVATVAQRLWNAAITANPIGALIAILAAAGTAIVLYSKKVDAASSAQKALSDTAKQAEKDSLAQTSAIKRNTGIIQDETKSLKEKLIAVNNLRDIMPNVLKDYSDEEILAGKATKAIQDQTDAIILQAKVRARQNKITEEETRLLDLQDQKERGFAGASFKERLSTLDNIFSSDYEKAYEKTMDKRIEISNAKVKALTDGILDAQGKLNKIHQDNPDTADEPIIPIVPVTPDGKPAKDKWKQLDNSLDNWKTKLLKQDPDADKEMVEIEATYRKLLKMAEGNEKAKIEITETYQKLKWQRELEILEIGAKKYRERQLYELDTLYVEIQDKNQQKYLDELKFIDQMDLTEQERFIEREQLRLENEEVERQREQGRLNARLLLLAHFESFGDLEIDEAKRVADEKAKIEKQITDNAIAENQRLAKEKQELSKAQVDADLAIQDATINAYQASFGVMNDLFKKNKALSNLFLILEKAAAAAHVVTSLQREIAGYYAAYALIPGGAAVATKLATAAKIRAGSALMTIAGQTIQGLSGGGDSKSEDSNRPSFTPRMPGREKGGTLVQRDQDGKLFNATIDPSKRGYTNKPTVIVGENGSEFVANAEAVANPSVKAFLDIIDTAQRNGSISTLSLQKVMSRSMASRMRGYQTGGYTGSSHSSAPALKSQVNENALIVEALKNNTDVMNRLEKQIQKGITAEVALLGKNGFIEKHKELTKIEDNASL